MNAQHYSEMPEELRKQIEKVFQVRECSASELAPETKLKLFEPKISNEEMRYRRQQQFGK